MLKDISLEQTSDSANATDDDPYSHLLFSFLPRAGVRSVFDVHMLRRGRVRRYFIITHILKRNE